MEALRHGRCPRCGQSFYVCEPCWRGQVYCCAECSEAGRERSVDDARRRYAGSVQGRKMHRFRQDRYLLDKRRREQGRRLDAPVHVPNRPDLTDLHVDFPSLEDYDEL